MQLKYLQLIFLTLNINLVHAYTQTDLLNAQTNYQTAKNNVEKSKTKYSYAQEDLHYAESYCQQAESEFNYAKRNLKQKQEAAASAKQNLDKSTVILNTAGSTVNNVWNQLNGKPKN